MTATDARLRFVRELDHLKGVLRRTRVLGGERLENTAEHSWHLAMMALSLAPEADDDVDVARVVELLLCHDVIEIDTDDTFVYDTAAREAGVALEQAAADRIFALLPDGEGARLRAAWEEYEHGTTPEAWFARAVDRFQPLLLNMADAGGSWVEHGIRADQVMVVNRGIAAGSVSLWEQAQDMVEEAVATGWLGHAAGEARDDVPGLPPELHTDRLRLRWPRLADAAAVHDGWAGDPEVTRYLTWAAHEDADSVRGFLRELVRAMGRGEQHAWLLELDGRVVGSVSAGARGPHGFELGYVLARDHWGGGLATEAVTAVTDAVLAATDAVRVQAYCDVDNEASARVLDRAGFVEEGVVRSYHRLSGFDEARDCRLFARTRSLRADSHRPEAPT